jgi:hypothetical protein
MAIAESADLLMMDEVRTLARRLDAAAHGEAGRIVGEFAKLTGWSRAKIYNRLRSIGWSSGRKPRADKGTTRQDLGALQDISFTIRNGVRDNGKATMFTPNAVSMLSQNGRSFTVSNSRINKLLRNHQMHLAAQRKDTPHQQLKSLHPNHVHQADPSLCLLYYMPDGKQYIMEDSEFYKNKLEKIAQIKLKVWRYVLTDHYSASIVVRYYEAKGETQANLYDFLLYAWAKREGRLIHGVPRILLWDKGSANTAGAIKNALASLDVEPIEHKAKNARAKGSVENANNLVECLFESRLAYEPVENVDQLNAAAEAWANAYNANTIPNYDSRLKRKYMSEPKARYAIWQTIRKEQLRILPDIDVCRGLLSGTEQERQVTRDLQISFKHPVSKQREHYDVAHIPGIYIGAKLRVSPRIYGNNEVVATFPDYQGEDRHYLLQPIEVDRFSGFAANAPVIGEEFRSRPHTVVEEAAKAADARAFPDMNAEKIEKAKARGDTPFGGLDAHSHLHHVTGPTFMDRPGERLTVPDRLQVEVKPLDHIELKMRLRALLGRPVTPEENKDLRAWYPEGVLEEHLQLVADRLQGKQDTAAKLVAVK